MSSDHLYNAGMCGFAGVIAWDEKYRVSRDTLAKMSAAVAHRGPDGEGMYFSPDAEITPDRPQVALAHRRLAIIDPDPRANQPFTDGEGRWLVYNGEIYNYRELRAELKSLKPEYEWRTDCDTEVLLVAYGVWGEKCVEHFNGMFAFAIWDGVKRELFLVRDRMGQKPLYCADVPNGIAFASEIPSLLALPWVDRTIHLAGLDSYLRFGYFSDQRTAYQAITCLQPAQWRTAARGTVFREGLSFTPNAPGRAHDASHESCRDALTRAVRRQLVADVPIGCLLSGGIDSSVVAALMRELRGDADVHTFSIGFNDLRYDESEHAANVAQHLGTKHRQFVVTPNAAQDLPLLAKTFGEPFGDSSALPTHYLARETRLHVKVALSGDGSDELFGGYDRYAAMRFETRLQRVPPLLRRTIAQQAWILNLGSTHPKSIASRASRFLDTIDLPAEERYSSYVRLFDDELIRLLVVNELAEHVPFEFDPLALDHLRYQAEGRDPVQAALAVDRVRYLPDDLLTKVDRASMLHALEVRSPFMDHELVTFAAGLTTDQLLKGGPKRMLREAFADDLPAWVFKRKKMGFAVPIGEWFRGELRPMLHDNLFASDSFGSSHFNMNVVRRLVEEHETFKVDHSQRLYALLMLELWWRTVGRNPM